VLVERLIASYAPRVATASFENLCAVLRARLDSIAHMTRLSPEEVEPAPEPGPALGIEDLVPYSAQRRKVLTKLTGCRRRLGADVVTRGDLHATCETIYDALSRRTSPENIESIFFLIADEVRPKDSRRAAELLYALSLVYERRGQSHRIPILDIATAMTLLKSGERIEAESFLAAARNRASSGANTRMLALLDALSTRDLILG
jgi:hypothetical protein